MLARHPHARGSIGGGNGGWATPGEMRRGFSTYLCISEADVLTPRHNNNTAPVMATSSRKRVLVRKTHIALVGGSVALAAFQLIPPFGRSISSFSGGPQHHPWKASFDVQLLEKGIRKG